jgi:hypothetical protein
LLQTTHLSEFRKGRKKGKYVKMNDAICPLTWLPFSPSSTKAEEQRAGPWPKMPTVPQTSKPAFYTKDTDFGTAC